MTWTARGVTGRVYKHTPFDSGEKKVAQKVIGRRRKSLQSFKTGLKTRAVTLGRTRRVTNKPALVSPSREKEKNPTAFLRLLFECRVVIAFRRFVLTYRTQTTSCGICPEDGRHGRGFSSSLWPFIRKQPTRIFYIEQTFTLKPNEHLWKTNTDVAFEVFRGGCASSRGSARSDSALPEARKTHVWLKHSKSTAASSEPRARQLTKFTFRLTVKGSSPQKRTCSYFTRPWKAKCPTSFGRSKKEITNIKN